MALTRAALREMGVTEKEILDAVMEAHGNSIESIKAKYSADLEAQKEKADKALAELQTKLDAVPNAEPDGKDWKSEYDTLQTKYDADIAAKTTEFAEYKAGIEEKDIKTKKQEAIKTHLEADGANPKLVRLLMGEFDLSKVNVEDGKVKDWEEASKAVKTNYADVFGEVTTKGAAVATPPPATGAKADDPFLAGFNEK